MEPETGVPEEELLPEGQVPEGEAGDGTDVDEAEAPSLEDTLEKSLEGLRAEDETDEPKVPDETPAPEVEGKAEEKPDAKPEGDTPADEEDPDAELLAGMKERTRERFTEMRTNLKAAEERIEQFQQGTGELHNVILESTATPQQLSGALQIFKMINAGDAVGAGQALGELKQLYNAVAQVAGQPELDGDPLQNHPDLQKAVDDLDMTPEQAHEMARLRVQTQQHQQRIQQQAQQEQMTVAQQQAARQAATSIKQWEDHLLTSDADYKLIQPKLVEMSQTIMQSFPPNEWLPRLQHEYNSIHAGLELQNRASQSAQPAPIRPDPSGGRVKPDTSNMTMEQTMEASLAAMRG